MIQAKKYIVQVIILGTMIATNNQVFATQTNIQQILDSNKYEQTTVDSSIEFKKDEYVKIIHPLMDLGESSFVTTFEKEINLMGEARAGTQISILVYNGTQLYKKYELDPVGATQTFNQLLSLREKDNTIILIYTHPDLENAEVKNSEEINSEEINLEVKNSKDENEIKSLNEAKNPQDNNEEQKVKAEQDLKNFIMFNIYRQPEENKLKIKNYIVSTPEDLPGNLVEIPQLTEFEE
ncbi:hypothetical protein AN643_00985 [Candidatus Epulonipiscioides saccharophilum]|nr:hypothetical protein AN643_00985 [Epulopiscium sp. SCG-B10WGA-EpuloB]